jgi:hypothetical protein
MAPVRTNGGLPPPWTRLARRRLSVAAVIFVAAACVAATNLSTRARVEITSQVDAHWRGAYDILVRPGGSRTDAATTDGLIERNFLGFTGSGGISPDELSKIRRLDGVEVAAPIAFVGSISAVSSALAIHVDSIPDHPTLFEVGVTVETSDGLSARTLTQSTGRVLIGIGSDGQPIGVSDYGNDSIGADPSGRIIVDIATDNVIPPVASQFLAVDPSAEQALIGPSGGFLDPLRAANAGRQNGGLLRRPPSEREESWAYSPQETP